MENTVGIYQDLQYRNVISNIRRLSVENLPQEIEGFLAIVRDSGYTPTDLFFYSINSPINDGTNILVEFFVPVVEDYQKGTLAEGYSYRSWFQVLDMVGTRVLGDRLEDFAEGITRLEEFITPKKKGFFRFFARTPQLEERTPPFFLTVKNQDKVYTDILVGVSRKD